jgi:TonB family protein
MRFRRELLAVLCIGVAFAGAHRSQGQEATSANLPDQFQTAEMASTFQPKKKKTESRSQVLATAPRQNVAPASEQAPGVKESPAIPPTEAKKVEPTQESGPAPLSHKPITATQEQSPTESNVVPMQKKQHAKRQPRRAIPPSPASVPARVPMSLSVAQSMAIRAPLPEYPYEARRRDVTGSGVCLISVDPGTGKVIDATMEQSTGDRVLDKVTTDTFKLWQFKPGTVSQVRLPISYE